MVSLAELARCLSALQGRTLITFHSLGDADCVCSALVLQKLCAGKAEVHKLDTLTAHARHVLEQLNLPEPPALKDLAAYDNLVLVDVSTPVLLGEWADRVQKFKGTRVIVDHHSHKTPLRADCYYNDASQASTGEIVYRLARLMNRPLGEREALLLLASVLRDTAMFKSATAGTFEVVSALLHKTRWPYPKVAALAELKPDISERIAHLKAGQRAKLYRADDLVFATATVSSFELGAAAALVAAGADAAFVANEKVGRMSGVKSESLPGVHIARLMERAGELLGGSGGGHENVGGAQGKAGRLAEALDACARGAAEQAGARKFKEV